MVVFRGTGFGFTRDGPPLDNGGTVRSETRYNSQDGPPLALSETVRLRQVFHCLDAIERKALLQTPMLRSQVGIQVRNATLSRTGPVSTLAVPKRGWSAGELLLL